MIRRYLFALFIMLLPNIGVFAQEDDDPIEKMNNIKLEGTYYTGEATATTAQEAEELAKLMLMENLDGKNVDDLKSQLKKIEIKRGDMTMMFVYLPKNAKKEERNRLQLRLGHQLQRRRRRLKTILLIQRRHYQ